MIRRADIRKRKPILLRKEEIRKFPAEVSSKEEVSAIIIYLKKKLFRQHSNLSEAITYFKRISSFIRFF